MLHRTASARVSLASGLLPPLGRLLIALREPLAVVVETPKGEHSIRLTLQSGLLPPLGPPLITLRDPCTVVVVSSCVVLTPRTPLPRPLLRIREGKALVYRHTPTRYKDIRTDHLREHVPLIRGLSQHGHLLGPFLASDHPTRLVKGPVYQPQGGVSRKKQDRGAVSTRR